MTNTYYGEQKMHHFLERSTWHTAHHVRQVMSVLDELGVPVRRRVADDAYDGLPMPTTLW